MNSNENNNSNNSQDNSKLRKLVEDFSKQFTENDIAFVLLAKTLKRTVYNIQCSGSDFAQLFITLLTGNDNENPQHKKTTTAVFYALSVLLLKDAAYRKMFIDILLDTSKELKERSGFDNSDIDELINQLSKN